MVESSGSILYRMKCHRQFMIIIKDICYGLIRGEDFHTFLRTSIDETYKYSNTNHYNHLIKLVVNNFPSRLLLNTENNMGGLLGDHECNNYINNVENNESFRIMLNIFYVNVYA